MERRTAGGAVAACPSPARRQQVFPACAIEALEQERSREPRGHQYTYFEVIFCGREGEALLHDVRISLLMNLCSLAVQYPCYSLLNHVSQWLHKIGNGKSYAQQLIALLVDHFILSPAEWNLQKFLLPLAEEVPEFVSYFVAYSVTKVTIRSPLIEVLAHWLTGPQSSRIISFIKETPTITKYFATNTFWLLVLYDCTSGCGRKSPLHGVTTMLYADWVKTPPLSIKPALEALVADDLERKFEPIVLYYHLHFARLSNSISRKELSEFLPRFHLENNYQTLLQSLK
uniref:Centromere protein I n=1 Tax=Ascaris lumbricoides TaxID=6252 RepID=A0A0M3IKP7_ASCLU